MNEIEVSVCQRAANPSACVGFSRLALFSIIAFNVLLSTAANAYGPPSPAFGTPMADVLCEIVNWFLGNLGRGLATIGVSAVAIGAIFGKVSWGLALTVAVGIAVMFGASALLIQVGILTSGVC